MYFRKNFFVKFWISLQLSLDFSVIFLDFSNALSNHWRVGHTAWAPEGREGPSQEARRASIDFLYQYISVHYTNSKKQI